MAKAWRCSDSWLEDAAINKRWLALSMAFKDAVTEGAEKEFLKGLQQVVKRDGVVQPNDIEQWRVFFVDTIPLLREEVQDHLTTAREFLPPEKLEKAQRALNATRTRRKR